MKPRADRRYLPASGFILVGMSAPLLWIIAQQWPPMADILSGPAFTQLLGLSLAAGGLALLAPHYHHHGPPPRRRAGSMSGDGPRRAARTRRAEGNAE
jgi:hypothetical protein